MPINGLSERGGGLILIGVIRKGGKKRKVISQKSGKEVEIVGQNLPHFRFDFDANETEAAQRALEVYGDKPNNLHILLPSPRLEDSWDCWYEAYAGGTMIHRCARHINGIDAGPIQSAADPQTGERLIVNGRDVKTGAVVMCKGEPIEYVKKNGQKETTVCKPIGRLTILLPIFDRLVSMLVVTHGKHDIANIDRQLHLIENLQMVLSSPIAGIELIMSRKLGETHYWQNGQRQTGKDWMINIEVDPDWLRENQYMLRMSRTAGGLLNEIAQPRGIEAPKTAGPDWSIVSDDDEDEDPIIDGAPENGSERPVTPQVISTPTAPAKKCSIKTPLFASRLIPALAAKTKYYNDGKDAPQPYHILASAAKCGYTEITSDNIEAVTNDLIQHAIEQTIDVPAQ